MQKHSVSAIFFDLDGTLLDTAPDLTAALNEVLIHHGLAPLPLKTVRPAVALGSKGILAQGFTFTENDPIFETLKQEFLETYARLMTTETVFFEGSSIKYQKNLTINLLFILKL